MIHLPQGPFTTVVADPPWPYGGTVITGNAGRGSQDGRAAQMTQLGAAEHYNLMSMKDLLAMPVSTVVADNAHLYLWTTNSFMDEAHDLARAWGFVPKTILTWVKIKKSQPTPCVSMKSGYYFRGATEHMLFAVRGRLRTEQTPRPTAYLWERIMTHSVKPDESYELVESASPGPYLELFARRQRVGWTCWGNELAEFDAEEAEVRGMLKAA